MSKNHLGYRYLLLSLPSVWCINLIAINFLGGYRTLHIYTYTYIERLFFFCIVFWAVKWKFFSSLVVCDAWIAAVPFGAIVVWLTVQSSFLWRCACEWTARKFWTHSERTYDDVPRIFVQYNPPNIIHTRVLRVNESVCVWVCNRSCTALNFKHNCIVAQAITAPIHLNALEKDSVCVCAFYTYFFLFSSRLFLSVHCFCCYFWTLNPFPLLHVPIIYSDSRLNSSVCPCLSAAYDVVIESAIRIV